MNATKATTSTDGRALIPKRVIRAPRERECSQRGLILAFEEIAGSTNYTALVRHWTIADREVHE